MPEEQKKPDIKQVIAEELVILNRKFVELQQATGRVVRMYEIALNPEKFKEKDSNEPDFKKPKELKVEKEENKPK